MVILVFWLHSVKILYLIDDHWMKMESQTLVSHFVSVEAAFNKACDQIRHFNQQLDGLQVRLDRAERDSQQGIQYSLRLKLAVMEGVRNMVCEYAAHLADDLVQTQCQLLTADERAQSSDDSDVEM